VASAFSVIARFTLDVPAALPRGIGRLPEFRASVPATQVVQTTKKLDKSVN
jgi:hypothetical protein